MKKNKIYQMNEKRAPAIKKGMSFIEAIVGIFIFSLVMLAITTIFTNSFGGYRKAEKMAKNIEDAQFAINLMAKTLRTSSVLDCNGGCDAAFPQDRTEIRFFDYSQLKCGRYVFFAGNLSLQSPATDINDAAACASYSSASFRNENMLNVYVDGNFSVLKSAEISPTDKRIGKVTIRMVVCSNDNCTGATNDQAVLQTTVSLRDYVTVGL